MELEVRTGTRVGLVKILRSAFSRDWLDESCGYFKRREILCESGEYWSGGDRGDSNASPFSIMPTRRGCDCGVDVPLHYKFMRS